MMCKMVELQKCGYNVVGRNLNTPFLKYMYLSSRTETFFLLFSPGFLDEHTHLPNIFQKKKKQTKNKKNK